MNQIKIFYKKSFFEKLQITRQFEEYLKKEKQKIKSCGIKGRILDIGCGNGRSTEILADLADYVIGIDFSKRLLNQAKKRLRKMSNVNFYLKDAKSMHFEDSSFDFVGMFWNTFGNLYLARDQVLKEVKRVLKPKGKILISVFAENILPAYLELLSINNLEVLKKDKDFIYLKEGLVSERFSRKKLKQIFKNVGLNLRIEQLTDRTYWCEATKSYLS